MENSGRLSDEEANRILDEILEEDGEEDLENDDDDEDDVDESEYCAADCAKRDSAVEKKCCDCTRIAENSSRFSLRVMEAMRWLQREEDALLPASSVEDIVGYIQANYRDDGDLYAQVRTVLKQVCSQGFVMELLENEYHLVGPNAISINQITCSSDREDCKLSVKTPKRRRKYDDKSHDCVCEATPDEESFASKSRRISMNKSGRAPQRQQEEHEEDVAAEEVPECSCSVSLTDEDIDECNCENEIHGSARDDSKMQRRVRDVQENGDGWTNEERHTKSAQENMMASLRRRRNNRENARTKKAIDRRTTSNNRPNEITSDNVNDIYEELRDQPLSRSKRREKELKNWIKRCQEECKRREKR